MIRFYETKDPDADLDWEFDWSDWMASGDSIVSSTMTIDGPDGALVKDSDSFAGTTATIWLSGGTLHQSYSVTNRITTAEGRSDDRTAEFTIVQK